MNAEQMKSTLAGLAVAFGAAGTGNVGAELTQLAGLFGGAGPTTVARFIAKIEANWKESMGPPRYPKQLKSILEKLKDSFSHSGAKTQTQDFAALLRLFSGVPDQSTATFVAEARSAFSAPKKKQ